MNRRPKNIIYYKTTRTYQKRIAPKESIEEPIVIKKSKSTFLNDSLEDIDDDLKVKDIQVTFSMSIKDGPGDLQLLARTDLSNSIHPCVFGITSHEKEQDYVDFYNGVRKLSKKLKIKFKPRYVMQDAWDASYNAEKSISNDSNVLMRYYHVMANCKKCYVSYSDLVKTEIKTHKQSLHFSIDQSNFERNLSKFKIFTDLNCKEFNMYLLDS
ncbi:hypothetical protein BpHYR1_019980 [Brachionus plicatilis]|uniref:Uncharacterized protein n=1 Tax=Brachionus plicatilis TaxID=10195 RepID=A0A3M7SBP5_BRAPC|nr:hypothetical protein BpHYR1_019980 [Brachionus plicatilis]